MPGKLPGFADAVKIRPGLLAEDPQGVRLITGVFKITSSSLWIFVKGVLF
jgi:hypothetical protein